MGAWGMLAFDNDHACDWASNIEKATDMRALELIEDVFTKIEQLAPKDVSGSLAEEGLAACEVLARLRGNFGYENAYTEYLDLWVRASKLVPSDELIQRANSTIDCILHKDSELRILWDDDIDKSWRATVEDLRARLLKK